MRKIKRKSGGRKRKRIKKIELKEKMKIEPWQMERRNVRGKEATITKRIKICAHANSHDKCNNYVVHTYTNKIFKN